MTAIKKDAQRAQRAADALAAGQEPKPTTGGGFVRDGRGLAGRTLAEVHGKTVVLTGGIERASGETFEAGERFTIAGRSGGLWHLRQGARELRGVSSFQIRLADG